MVYNIKKKRKNNKDIDYDSSRRPEAIRFKSHGFI